MRFALIPKFTSRWLAAVYWLAFLCTGWSQSTPPVDYYNNAIGKTGTTLKTALHDIIDDHTFIPYTSNSTDTWDALKVLDRDPNNSSRVILIYSGASVPNLELNDGGTWNREHLWPQSFGVDNGVANTDLFNLRAVDENANSSRGNKYFDTSTGTIGWHDEGLPSTYDNDSWEPRDADKGTISRSMFYMAVRYNGTEASVPDLELSDSPSSGNARFGKLTTLLGWQRKFPVTAAERTRNHLIYTNYQHNRNPFVDHPEFVDMVFLNATALQAWKNLRFSDVEILNPNLSGDLADADGDLIPNLVEYKFNRNPRVPESSPLLTLTKNPDGSLQVVCVRNRFATDVTMTYEISTDLKIWTLATPQSSTTTVQSYEVEQVSAKIAGPSTGFFVHVKLVKP